MELLSCKSYFPGVQVQNKTTTALSPSIVETYSRLLVYSEMESLGIKGFLNQLLPKVFAQQSWGTLNTLLEIFSFRLHHIQVTGTRRE